MSSTSPASATAAGFRAQFPVLERLAYLNAGTEGPIPRATADAVRARVESEAAGGRCGKAYFEDVMALAGGLREGYAGVLGCAGDDVALTGSTTDGVNTVIAGLDLRRGDEIVTTDEEHPGLLAPLGLAARRHGVSVRVVPFADVAEAVTARTRLVACSHVSWVSGRVVDAAALKASGVSFLLDGAQGVGAVPVDVDELGCDFYAGSGQKWLCGPEGSGCLYVRAERRDEVWTAWPGYGSLADAQRALELLPAEGSKRYDHGFPSGLRSTYALASLEVFEQAGWDWVHERAASLSEQLAQRLTERGLKVWPRGRSTLVSWEPSDDAQTMVERLAAEGIVVRSIPTHGLVRASIGAWSSEEDVERLVALAGG